MKLIWRGLLNNLECLLALLLLGGCVAGTSSLGIGPLMFIIIAITRLSAHNLGERAKLWNTALTASILGAIARFVFAFAMASLAQQISGTKILYSRDVPDSVEMLMFAGPVLISGLVGVFVASQFRGRDVTKVAVLATYVALGGEGWCYIFGRESEALGVGWAAFLSSSLIQLIAAGLGATLFSSLARRRHRESSAAVSRSGATEEAKVGPHAEPRPRPPLFFTTSQWLVLALLGIAVIVILGCLISMVGLEIASQ